MKYILILIAFSLTSVVGLQIYYGVQVFIKEKTNLQEQLDNSIENAVLDAEDHRINTINGYYAADLHNKDLVIIEMGETEDGPSIFLLDPKTGYSRASHRIDKKKDTVNNEDDMVNLLVNTNHTFLEQRSIWFWTDTLGLRLKAYNDSVDLNTDYLNQSFASELDKRQIEAEFEIIYDSDTSELVNDTAYMLSKIMNINLIADSRIYAKLFHPDQVVLSRISTILLITLFALLLVIASFGLLWRFANRQKKLSQLKEDFIDNVTHELITPVATLKLALESQRNHLPPSAESTYVDISEQQAYRIASVIDHVLTVSFVDHLASGLKFERFQLNELINEVLTYYKLSIKKSIIVSFNPTSVYTINSDRHQLSSALHNVINNAIKYGPESDSLVMIDLEQKKDRILINISDNGHGIPKSDQDAIFEKFHRVHSQTHDVKGMGIGLYYCRELLDKLGGSIQLTQSSGDGSTFTITLPYEA